MDAGVRAPRSGFIGDLNRWEAVMLVNEHDIRFLKEGQPVKLLIDSQVNHRIARHVESIARKESEQVPGSSSLGFGGKLCCLNS